MILFAIIFAVIVLYVLLLKGGHAPEGLDALRGWVYAHRGLHEDGVPENSMAAFRAAKDAGYGVELDVHLMKDGKLAVIHDASLLRTAGAEVAIEDLSEEQLSSYYLENTQEKIPLLSQVLELFQGKVPLIVELKPVNGNHAALCETACNLLQDYNGAYCLESFDPRCIIWLRKHRSNMIRGQLTENFFRSSSDLSVFLKFAMKHQLFNFLTKPHFVAYRYSDRKTISNYVARKIWGLQGVTWTICSQEDLNTAVQEGWIPIFESFRP